MARASRWSKEQRAKLWKMVRSGIAEQEIRDQFTTDNGNGGKRGMTAVEFAQQLKQAMVEAGDIKQVTLQKKADEKSEYEVTRTGRLTINDFAQITGAAPGEIFVLEKPRGRSKAWRVVPVAK
jgi:predicted transcriptional regulator